MRAFVFGFAGALVELRGLGQFTNLTVENPHTPRRPRGTYGLDCCGNKWKAEDKSEAGFLLHFVEQSPRLLAQFFSDFLVACDQANHRAGGEEK
jgi:hypothetical protein